MSQTTPDSDFILDRHPVYSNVVIGAGFSGNAADESRVQGVRRPGVGGPVVMVSCWVICYALPRICTGLFKLAVPCGAVLHSLWAGETTVALTPAISIGG